MKDARAGRGRPRPILVTGMPRSGTTWLARLLATAPHTALPGREPMNPRRRQYALAGTLPGWTAVERWTRSQERALKSAYGGYNPRTYSRYGRHQYTAPLPFTRVIVKDPFAMLSIPAVTRATGAVPVLVYRHPAAALVSYRRMGWQPDLDELRSVVADRHIRAAARGELRDRWAASDVSQEACAMGLFWSTLYDLALNGVDLADDVVIVSHEELAAGGELAVRALFRQLGLQLGASTLSELDQHGAGGSAATHTLHNFERSPVEAAQAWRAKVSPDELHLIEETTRVTRRRLEDLRVRLLTD